MTTRTHTSTNCGPPEGEYEKDTAWEPVKARLHPILADAAKETKYQHDPHYTASATEQEILHGAQGDRWERRRSRPYIASEGYLPVPRSGTTSLRD